MRNVTPEWGSVSVDNIQVYSRRAAGLALTPKRSERTVRRYLTLLGVFDPRFKEFIDPVTGGLRGDIKITHWHLGALQRIADLVDTYRNMTTIKLMYKNGRI